MARPKDAAVREVVVAEAERGGYPGRVGVVQASVGIGTYWGGVVLLLHRPRSRAQKDRFSRRIGLRLIRFVFTGERQFLRRVQTVFSKKLEDRCIEVCVALKTNVHLKIIHGSILYLKDV